MKDFYADPENLIEVLRHYLSIFSEGRWPMVPACRATDGTLDVRATLDLPSFSEFPAIEKQHWIEFCGQ